MATIKKAQFGRSMVVKNKPCRPGECGPGVDRKATRQARRESRMADRRMRRMKDGGKSFPDLSGDGQVTKKDVLIGRGVIKNGGNMKKAKAGASLKPKGVTAANVSKRLGSRLRAGGTLSPTGSNVSRKLASPFKKKARGGATLAPSKKSTSNRLASNLKMKTGGKMKMGGKCRGGCY